MCNNDDDPLNEALLREAKGARVDAYMWRNLLRNKSREYIGLQNGRRQLLQEQEKEIVERIEAQNRDLISKLRNEVDEWRNKAEQLMQNEENTEEKQSQTVREDQMVELQELRKQCAADQEELIYLRKECNHWLRKHEILRNEKKSLDQAQPPGDPPKTHPNESELIQELERWKEKAASWKQEALLWRKQQVEVTGGRNREATPIREEIPEPIRAVIPKLDQSLTAHRQRIFELERELLLQRKRVEKWKTRCVVNEENYKRKIAAHETRFDNLSQALQLYEESLILKPQVRNADGRVTTRGYKGEATRRTPCGHNRSKSTYGVRSLVTSQ